RWVLSEHGERTRPSLGRRPSHSAARPGAGNATLRLQSPACRAACRQADRAGGAYHLARTVERDGRRARDALLLTLMQPLNWAATLAFVALVPHFLGARGFGAFAVTANAAMIVGAL